MQVTNPTTSEIDDSVRGWIKFFFFFVRWDENVRNWLKFRLKLFYAVVVLVFIYSPNRFRIRHGKYKRTEKNYRLLLSQKWDPFCVSFTFKLSYCYSVVRIMEHRSTGVMMIGSYFSCVWIVQNLFQCIL